MFQTVTTGDTENHGSLHRIRFELFLHHRIHRLKLIDGIQAHVVLIVIQFYLVPRVHRSIHFSPHSARPEFSQEYTSDVNISGCSICRLCPALSTAQYVAFG